MTTFSRRSFLKQTFSLGAGVLGASLLCETGYAGVLPAPPRRKNMTPLMGVCTGLNNREIAEKAGCEFIEEGVSRFLVPDKTEAEFEVLLRKLSENKLKVLSCNGFIPSTLRLTGPELNHKEALVWADTAIRRAGKAGVQYIVFGSGGARKIPEGFSRDTARDQFVSLCKAIGPMAKKAGVTIVIEPLNRTETNFINSVTEGADIVKRVNHPNIRLLADIYHMLRESEGPQSILQAGKLLRHCHIAEKETRSAPGVKGDDFTPYFAALSRIGYRGAISIESGWKDFGAEIAPAIETMRKQWAML